MSFLNVVERHKAPFARGDAFVLAGDLDSARAQFEQALELAPPDSIDSCQIRVNLALALEKLGDAAKAAGDDAGATRKLGRAVQIATATGDEEMTSRLKKVVEIDNAEAGTVRLRKSVEKLDEMALDTASTKTRRIKK